MCPCNADPPADPTPPPAGYAPGRSIAGLTPLAGRPAGPLPVLVADDDVVSLRVLEGTLGGWGYEVTAVRDGLAAWDVLRRPDRPRLAVIDWMMPGLEGPEVCRRARALGRAVPTYLILLTARDQTDDIVAGLDSGADDYVTKPFHRPELRSRLRVGERVVALQQGLADRVKELEVALGQVKQLKGLLPICSYCKKVRDDRNYWQRVETYIAAHTEARFSHGICPDCWAAVIEPDLAARVGDGTIDPRDL